MRQMPLVNADRLTLSLLPPVEAGKKLKAWANRLRDEDERWQKLSQDGVQLFMGLAMDQGVPFAFETVFSYNNRRSVSRRLCAKMDCSLLPFGVAGMVTASDPRCRK
jgi:hypothetical protein